MRWIIVILSLLPLTLLSQPQYEWAYGLGGPGDDWVTDVLTDDFGNVYVTGTFQGILRYDTAYPATIIHDTVTNLLSDDAFLVKLSPSGRLLWSKTFGSYGYDLGKSLALSSSGSLYWAGGYTDTMHLDGFTLHMADSMPYLGGIPADNFVAKLDTATGECVALRQIGGVGRDNLQWIGTDPADNLWVVGTTASRGIDFGGISVDSARLYLAKYSPDDSLLFVIEGVIWDNYWFSNNNRVQSADISEQGEVHLSFTTVANLIIDGQQICTEGCHLWLKISPEGDLLNWRDITDFPGKVAAGPNGSSFLAGYFNQPFQIDSLAIDGGERRNMYTLRLDSMGKLIWVDYWATSSIAGGPFPYVSQIAFRNDKVYWIGNWEYPIFLSNGDSLTTAGMVDGILIRYDKSGSLDWAKQVGGNSDNYLDHITLSPKGEIYTVGSFYSFITLADTIVIPNTFGGLDRFEYWIGKMQDSVFTTSLPVSVSSPAIKVYPNPFQEVIQVEGLSPGRWEIQLVNAQGQEIAGMEQMMLEEQETCRMHVPQDLPAGMYLLTLQSSSGKAFSIRMHHP